MKKLFLITIILLFQSFHSFGDPNGKGLICDLKDSKNLFKVEGYLFENNKVQSSRFYTENDKISIDSSLSLKYSLSKTHITWKEFWYYYELDRKSLMLEMKTPDSKIQKKMKCKVFSKKEFIVEMVKQKDYYQKIYNEETKDNKI